MDLQHPVSRRAPMLIIRRHARWVVLVFAALFLAGCAVLGGASGFSLVATCVVFVLMLAGCGIPDVASERASNPNLSIPSNPPNNVAIGSLGTGDGSLGFIFRGPPGSRAGTSISLGDLDGDGFADVAIGAPHYATSFHGGAFVVFGGTAHGAVVDAVSASSTVVGSFYGQFAYDYAGTSVAFVGDVNGDGIDDLAIGSPRNFPNTGSVQIPFGSSIHPFHATLNSSLFSPSTGAYFIGFFCVPNYGERVGANIVPAGDLNGDGLPDFLVGAPGYTAGGSYALGKVYQTFMSTGAFTTGTSYTLSPASATKDSILIGPPSINANLGAYALAGGGDVDGDGSADVLIGMPGTFNTYDHAFVHFNPAATKGQTGSFPSVTFPHFGFRELNAGDGTGVAGALGDLDGDGLADVIVGSPLAHRNLGIYDYSDQYTGRVHIIFGSPALPGTSMVETQLDGTKGFSIVGANPDEAIGQSIAFGGDINGDGHPDLLFVANDVSYPYVPHKIVYVVFGGPRPGVSEVHLSQLTAAQGMIISGIPGYDAVVAGRKDVDGDGWPDVVIGSRYANSSAGAVYVIYHKALQ